MTEVFVVAPPGVSGGPELAHQLVHHLNTERPGRASIVYEPFEIPHKTPEPYRRYDVRPERVSYIPRGSTVVLPEVYGRMLDRFPGCRIMFWWMSVNNFHKATAGNAGAVDGLRRHVDCHLYQSEYARGFLASARLGPVQRLSDQLAADYLDAITVPPSAPRRDLVAFNPAKGHTRTKLIFYALTKSLRPTPQVVALEGLTRTQMRRTLAEAKVYIDFGEHPGKDRLPREAAALGACVLTNRRGAAGNPVDVPIPEDCKIDDRKPRFACRAANKIRQLIDDFDRQAPRFDGYRGMIASEPAQFFADVAAVFTDAAVPRISPEAAFLPS